MHLFNWTILWTFFFMNSFLCKDFKRVQVLFLRDFYLGGGDLMQFDMHIDVSIIFKTRI